MTSSLEIVDRTYAPAPENGESYRGRTRFLRSMIPQAILQRDVPAPLSMSRFVEAKRTRIVRILNRVESRLLVVVGPCSVHDYDEAIEYAHLLKGIDPSINDRLQIVMRVYLEKPRTSIGWKGYINDPDLDGSMRIEDGLRRARKLLVEINALGVPVATEFLDPMTPQYLIDLIAWGAIGARTVESATHRQMASGLDCPIGFKNRTDGDVQVAVDAIRVARARHKLIGLATTGQVGVVETSGNEHTHIVLRGGKGGPNFDAHSVERSCSVLRSANLPERLVVDCSHGNSNKSHVRQIGVVQDLCRQLVLGERRIVGVMLESNLEEGRQDFIPGKPLRRGVSVTDACLSWQQTRTVLDELAAAVEERNIQCG